MFLVQEFDVELFLHFYIFTFDLKKILGPALRAVQSRSFGGPAHRAVQSLKILFNEFIFKSFEFNQIQIESPKMDLIFLNLEQNFQLAIPLKLECLRPNKYVETESCFEELCSTANSPPKNKIITRGLYTAPKNREKIYRNCRNSLKIYRI